MKVEELTDRGRAEKYFTGLQLNYPNITIEGQIDPIQEDFCNQYCTCTLFISCKGLSIDSVYIPKCISTSQLEFKMKEWARVNANLVYMLLTLYDKINPYLNNKTIQINWSTSSRIKVPYAYVDGVHIFNAGHELIQENHVEFAEFMNRWVVECTHEEAQLKFIASYVNWGKTGKNKIHEIFSKEIDLRTTTSNKGIIKSVIAVRSGMEYKFDVTLSKRME